MFLLEKGSSMKIFEAGGLCPAVSPAVRVLQGMDSAAAGA